ncbi:MAG: hypothetical protein ACO2OW_01510 [Minisyncoccia bacterium]
MEEINENKNYLRELGILSQSLKLIGDEIKEKLKTERGVRLIFIPEWKEFSDAQKELFLDIVVSPFFILKIDDEEVKSAIISCLENLPQKYGGEKIHGGETSLSYAINTVAVNLSQYLRKNLEKEHIKKYREAAKNLTGKEQIRGEWQIFLLGCLNFWDFNNFKNFEKEIEKFRKRNRIDVGRFKEEREKIWQIFVEHLSDEYAKKINEEVEWLKNAVDLLDRYIKGEIDESRLFPVINLDYWRKYMIENILEIDRNDTDLIKQKENEITEIFKKEVKEKIKPYYENRVKVLSKKEFVRDEIIRNLYSKGYQQIKYWRLEDLIQLVKRNKLEVYTTANFVFFDENDLKIKYGVGATSNHPIEDLFVLVLIKKENELYSFKKLKEKIEKHPKLKRIPEYFQCLLKDYIFYGDFNEKDWDLIRAHRSKNANKDLSSIKNIFQDENGRNFDDYITPNRFLRRATAFYIMEGILIEKAKTALEDRNISPFLRHILEEKLGEDIEKLNEYLRRQKSKKTKSYWNLINSIMLKLGYLPIGRKEYFDFERIMKIF